MESEDMTQEPAPHDWLAKERHRALQQEAQACRKESGAFETICVGGVMAAYIWIARDSDLYTAPTDLIWFLPPIAAFYGALRSQAIALRLAQIRREIESLEQTLGAPVTARPRGERRRWLAHRIAWIGFFALTVLASVTGFEGGLTGDDDDDGQDQATSAAVTRPPIPLLVADVKAR